jgi:hypothetical protein
VGLHRRVDLFAATKSPITADDIRGVVLAAIAGEQPSVAIPITDPAPLRMAGFAYPAVVAVATGLALAARRKGDASKVGKQESTNGVG